MFSLLAGVLSFGVLIGTGFAWLWGLVLKPVLWLVGQLGRLATKPFKSIDKGLRDSRSNKRVERFNKRRDKFNDSFQCNRGLSRIRTE